MYVGSYFVIRNCSLNLDNGSNFFKKIYSELYKSEVIFGYDISFQFM